jgi:hypothetical protein
MKALIFAALEQEKAGQQGVGLMGPMHFHFFSVRLARKNHAEFAATPLLRAR